MLSNLTLMKNARKALENYWLLAAGVTLIAVLITGIPPEIDSLLRILVLIITGPLQLGIAIFSLNIARDNNPKFENLFDGFKHFGKGLLAWLLVYFLIIIGFILLIIPGIIVSLGFSLTFYIIADNPNLSVIDAMEKSWKMMNGHKLQMLRLVLRFIPWIILGFLALFVGMLFIIPWMQVTIAGFYEELKTPEKTD